MLVEPLLVGESVDDVGLGAAHLAEGTVVDGGVDLHAPGVDHRTEEGVVFQFLGEQHGHAEQLERGDGDEAQVAAIAYALGHRHTNAETRVGAGATTHRHGVEGDGVVVGEREGLVDE